MGEAIPASELKGYYNNVSGRQYGHAGSGNAGLLHQLNWSVYNWWLTNRGQLTIQRCSTSAPQSPSPSFEGSPVHPCPAKSPHTRSTYQGSVDFPRRHPFPLLPCVANVPRSNNSSVAEKVLGLVPCPVLTVGSKQPHWSLRSFSRSSVHLIFQQSQWLRNARDRCRRRSQHASHCSISLRRYSTLGG